MFFEKQIYQRLMSELPVDDQNNNGHYGKFILHQYILSNKKQFC